MDGGRGPRRAFLGGDVESSAETTGKGYFILNEAVDGEGIGDDDVAALLLTLSLRYVLIFWWRDVSMGVSVGVEPFVVILLRSSADLDQGRRERLRRSP